MPYAGLAPNEIVAGRLRSLFEERGFLRTTPGKFEDYHLYVDNRNFLDCEHVITFTDMDGRLLALKPDVTLSIVKNIPDGELSSSEKLYYIDEVYRPSRETHDYKVTSQIGVELIGPSDPFSSVEAVELALRSLSLIDEDFVLDISHLGFISGLFEGIDLTQSLKSAIIAAVHAKSVHELEAVLRSSPLAEADAKRILALAELHGPFRDLLPRVRELCVNDTMLEAYHELSRLGEVLCKNGLASHVLLDFSVVSDLDYYNGLLFLGYVRGVPKAVLSGGRYDNLLARLGKKSCAIGFGISLSELNPYRRNPKKHDFDALVSYAPGCDFRTLLEARDRLLREGKSVRLEPLRAEEKPFSCAEYYRFTEDNRLEVAGTC